MTHPIYAIDVRYILHYVGRRTTDMSEIFSFTAAFIAVQIFKIILFKKDKDYSGYDERQELIRGRAFRYGFLTLAFSLAAVVLWEECCGRSAWVHCRSSFHSS